MLNVNGSRRFIWNVSGRHDTCGHTSDALGARRGVRRHDLLVPRVALDGEQRGPRERAAAARWTSNTSACVTFSPGSSAATPLRASRSGSSTSAELVEVGDA